MRVKRIVLQNFRNYEDSAIDLNWQRNIILGENAQGKSNFLEAIELLANGYSDRARQDVDLIRTDCQTMRVEVICESGGSDHSLAFSLKKNTITNESPSGKLKQVEKKVELNGLSSSLAKKLRGRLVTVSFKSEDLNLLRGTPKFRRDWLDRIIVSFSSSYRDTTSRYLKVLVQRNRLLKILAEKGKITGSDRDELKAWDEQAAQYGSTIIKHRLDTLKLLLPKAADHQAFISGRNEVLSIKYNFKKRQSEDVLDDDFAISHPRNADSGIDVIDIKPDPELNLKEPDRKVAGERSFISALQNSYEKSRYEEISRGQTLFGPHRDDINFLINGMDATAFASQGQQRSLVLSLKLAELKLISEKLEEPPVLLLDDVLAELDLTRQKLLMSLIQDNMQTIISTTHLNNFHEQWLPNALFINVQAGKLTCESMELPPYSPKIN